MSLQPAPKLPDWLEQQIPWERHIYRGDLDIHFIDAGRKDAPVVYLQHGNPTWSFLWRKVIDFLLQFDVRCIAPDLVGLGFSDRRKVHHTPELHADAIGAMLDGIGVDKFVIAGQDWGGPVASLVAAARPDRVTGAVFGNTALHRLERDPRRTPFHKFSRMPVISDMVFRGLNFPVPAMPFTQGDRKSIGVNELRAYNYPLKLMKDRRTPLALARMVPQFVDEPQARPFDTIHSFWEKFDGPVQIVWGMNDPILGPALKRMQALFPDALVTETEAGHFLQEEVPDILAGAIIEVGRSAGYMEKTAF